MEVGAPSLPPPSSTILLQPPQPLLGFPHGRRTQRHLDDPARALADAGAAARGRDRLVFPEWHAAPALRLRRAERRNRHHALTVANELHITLPDGSTRVLPAG